MADSPPSRDLHAAFREAYAAARKDAVLFTGLTVLLTPPAVVLAVFLVLLAFQYINIHIIGLLGYPRSFATALNVFLGFLLVCFFARRGRNPSATAAGSRCLGAAVMVLGLMLFLSYGTALSEAHPGWFWTLYAGLGLLYLGLLGRLYEPAAEYYLGWLDGHLDDPLTVRDDIDRGHIMLGLVSLVPSTILESYGEVTGGGWILRGLDDGQQRLAAEWIGALASGNPRFIERVQHQLDEASAAKILHVLDRMKLVRFDQHRPRLTHEGEKMAGTNAWY